MNYTYEELKKMEIPLGKAKDITGMKFGKLTTLFRVKNKGDRVAWACKCDCGNYKIGTAHDLQNGHVNSCGCINIDDISGQCFGNITPLYPTKYREFNSVVWFCQCNCGEYLYVSHKDLINGARVNCNNHFKNTILGNKYNHITPIAYCDTKNNKSRFWCQCDCGKIFIAAGSDIKSGNTKSCGCINHLRNDLINQKFGKLTAIEVDEELSDTIRGTYWKCSCECGGNITTRANSLLTGDVISCGCINYSIGEQNIKNILETNNYSYISQMKFETCRYPDTNALARFDFYVSSEDCFLLEFDGPQHEGFNDTGWNTKEKFIKTLNHDLYKNQWAYENEMPLKRIPYQYRDTLTIDDILSDRFLITPDTHPQYYPTPNSSYPYITL